MQLDCHFVYAALHATGHRHPISLDCQLRLVRDYVHACQAEAFDTPSGAHCQILEVNAHHQEACAAIPAPLSNAALLCMVPSSSFCGVTPQTGLLLSLGLHSCVWRPVTSATKPVVSPAQPLWDSQCLSRAKSTNPSLRHTIRARLDECSHTCCLGQAGHVSGPFSA